MTNDENIDEATIAQVMLDAKRALEDQKALLDVANLAIVQHESRERAYVKEIDSYKTHEQYLKKELEDSNARHQKAYLELLEEKRRLYVEMTDKYERQVSANQALRADMEAKDESVTDNTVRRMDQIIAEKQKLVNELESVRAALEKTTAECNAALADNVRLTAALGEAQAECERERAERDKTLKEAPFFHALLDLYEGFLAGSSPGSPQPLGAGSAANAIIENSRLRSQIETLEKQIALLSNPDVKGGPEKEEPIFVLRARDALAPEIVREWAFRARRLGVRPDKWASAKKIADAMEDWQIANARRVPD